MGIGTGGIGLTLRGSRRAITRLPHEISHVMELTNCPMCHGSIPTESSGLVKTCSHCGADLARWMRKSVTPPPAQIQQEPPEATGEFNLGRGVMGALGGAAVGAAAMYGFYALAGFRFPLLGVGIGALTGYGAKLLYKGRGNELGIISGGVALAAVVGTLYMMYGTFPIISIISVAVSVSVAYRIASG
jgi:hypothetical protein